MSAEGRRKATISSSWSEARALLGVHRARLSLGLVLVLVNRAVGLVLPASSKVLIDEVIGKGRSELLWPIALAGGAATFLQAGTGYALSQILGVAAQRAIHEMRLRVQAHVMRLPVKSFDATQTGVLVSRIMNDAEGIRNLVGTGLVQLVGGCLTALVGIGVLLWLNWTLTLWILVALALFGVVMGVAFKKLRPLFRERGKLTGEATGRLNQTLGGVRVVKAYVAEAEEERVFATNAGKLFDNVRRSMIGVSATTAGSVAIVGVVGVILTLFGGRAVVAGEMTLGELVMYLVFIGLVVGPVVSIASIGTQISEAFAGLDRIREILDEKDEFEGDAERAPCPAVRGEILFEDVHFAYESGKEVLKGISFRAPAGTTTALVGSSGSGKSTLVSLVMGFHRPSSGRILVDGRPLDGLKLGDYRAHLGVVLQDNFLFDGTIAENIGFSRPGAPREAILLAARAAHCEEFVKGFEQSYDTIVGERGVRLSGGQRQRVAIARALLAEPSLLILDEATSSLDSESEAMIQEALARLRAKRTTFVIAHRLSTIRSADQILVLEHGEIVERGTHRELLAAAGRYKELHDRQYRFEHERFVNPGEEHPGDPGE